MHTRVRHFLIDIARRRTNQTVTYQQLSDQCRLQLQMSDPSDRNTLADILRLVSTYEHKNGRPLLSSLVIRAGDGGEGDGFFRLGEGLGFGDWQRLKREGIFAVQQMAACIEFWRNDANYERFR